MGKVVSDSTHQLW